MFSDFNTAVYSLFRDGEKDCYKNYNRRHPFKMLPPLGERLDPSRVPVHHAANSAWALGEINSRYLQGRLPVKVFLSLKNLSGPLSLGATLDDFFFKTTGGASPRPVLWAPVKLVLS